jgi:hypothetical protein
MWRSFRAHAGFSLQRVGSDSLWQEHGAPGLDALQFVLISGAYENASSDVFRIVRSQSPVVMTHRALRTCAAEPPTADSAGIVPPHLVTVTFPDSRVDQALLARLASCTQGDFWTTPTIDETFVFESTPVLAEVVSGGRYQAVHFQYPGTERIPLDSDDATRRALKECFQALAVAWD